MFLRRPMNLACGARAIIVTGIAAMVLASSAGAASAQSIFEALFGRLWSSPPTAYADPNAPLFGRPENVDAGGVAYCVRLCDGRYFPIQRHAGVTPAQACSSFCPASATKIYNGSSIERAMAPDGKRYAELGTAFVYREKIVPGCTCNGRDAFGLVNPAVEDDPTLRAGDIVATNGGLMAYNGDAKEPSFTPIAAYSALSPEVRRQLTETKIAPKTTAAAKPPVAPPAAKEADAAARTGKGKRVQLDR